MYRAAAYEFSLAKRFFTLKWLNDLLPFQARMHKYGQASMAGYPYECDCDSEDHDHLLHCPSPRCQETSASLEQDLDTLCNTHKIDPDLHHALFTLVGPTWGLVTDYALPPPHAAIVQFQLGSLKWLNDLLPFQARMHKYGQASMAGCPHECDCDSKDHDHLLHCPSPRCQETSASLEQDLDTLCNTHKLDPDLHRVLLTLVGPTWGLITDYALPPPHAAIVQFQLGLHRDSMFMGCFSTEWVRLQAVHLARNQYPRDKRQAETGIRSILSFLLEHVHRVWLARNLALHGDDTTTQLLSYRHTQLLLDIQDLYDQQEDMLAIDRRLFTKPYDYWLNQPTAQLKTFLLRMRPTIKTSVLQAADMDANFRTIDTYFPPPIPQAIIDAIHIIPYFPPEPN
jgi:hypothetical protein